MNLQTPLPVTIREGIKTMPKADRQEFFNALRREQYRKIASTKTTEELTDIRACDKLLVEMEAYFELVFNSTTKESK